MKLILGIILFISAEFLFAQGFDWQYSYRGQSQSPKFFWGMNSEFAFSYQSGDINFSEEAIPCCRFRNGNGNEFKIGIVSEYWIYSGVNSLISTFAYSNSNSSFTANPDPVYYLHDTLYTELEFENRISKLQFSFLFKHRVNLSHLFIAGGLGIEYLSSNSYKHSERIVASDLTFNDGTVERIIDNGNIPKLTKILLSHEFKVGYDFNLGLGLYGSMIVGLKFNINEIADKTDWRYYSLSVGINLLKGF